MGYVFIIISWFLRTYGAVQKQRSPIETPLALQGDVVKTSLVLIWILLLGIGSYLVFSSYGFIVLAISLILYFVIAPILFGKIVKKIMDKFGF